MPSLPLQAPPPPKVLTEVKVVIHHYRTKGAESENRRWGKTIKLGGNGPEL